MPDFLDFVFPKRCVLCGGLLELENDTGICSKCREKICGVQICHHCGEIECKCHKTSFEFDFFFTCSVYFGEAKTQMISFKHGENHKAAKGYANLLFSEYAKHRLGCDAVVCVPASEKRIKERGFNCAELIAKEFSKISGVRFIKNALKMSREIVSQHSLDYAARQNNVKGAYQAKNIDASSILLIDDIKTTGSTLSECARELKLSGAGFVAACAPLSAFSDADSEKYLQSNKFCL